MRSLNNFSSVYWSLGDLGKHYATMGQSKATGNDGWGKEAKMEES